MRHQRSGLYAKTALKFQVANEYAEQTCLLLSQKTTLSRSAWERGILCAGSGLCLYGHELMKPSRPVEAGLQWVIKKPFGYAQGTPLNSGQGTPWT